MSTALQAKFPEVSAAQLEHFQREYEETEAELKILGRKPVLTLEKYVECRLSANNALADK